MIIYLKNRLDFLLCYGNISISFKQFGFSVKIFLIQVSDIIIKIFYEFLRHLTKFLGIFLGFSPKISKLRI